MNIIKTHAFVIETKLPVSKGEDLTKVTINADTKVKDVRYAYQWYAGVSLMPGTGCLDEKTGQPVMPVWVNIWSPYFEDAQLFDDREKANAALIHAVGKETSGYSVLPVEQSNYKQSWKYDGK